MDKFYRNGYYTIGDKKYVSLSMMANMLRKHERESIFEDMPDKKHRTDTGRKILDILHDAIIRPDIHLILGEVEHDISVIRKKLKE